jgi:hypothetical protein
MGIAPAYDLALHPIILPRDMNDGFPSHISGGRMTQSGRIAAQATGYRKKCELTDT